ncbi:MAG: nuclear transport factor 2 family protein [Frankiaceae bacterium]|nr:nuclear transport factor 2 family protein [Frankiaceae bacterium]MBV9870286.1 nuclear transport factor 2 family protein [Frankiaceae bacterium]
MSFSDTEVKDRLEIQHLISRYADIIDGQRFDELDDIFTADAVIDYSTFGVPVGGVAEIKEFLRSSFPFFERTQHMMGLPHIEVSGDSATARTSCNNPMVSKKRDGTSEVWLIGLWYDDELVRTDAGWRFAKRTETRCYTLTGLPDSPMGA